MIGRAACIFGTLALAAGAAALADPPAATPAASPDPALATHKADPNRMVCRTEIEGASRLDRRRACHTAAEWAELRRQTRENIDHIQTNRPGSY